MASASAPTPTGYPAVVAAAIRERLHREDVGVTHVLYVEVGNAGGETIARRSLFKRRAVLVFLGGCQVSHLLLRLSDQALTGATSAWTATVGYDLSKNTLERVRVRLLSSDA